VFFLSLELSHGMSMTYLVSYILLLLRTPSNGNLRSTLLIRFDIMSLSLQFNCIRVYYEITVVLHRWTFYCNWHTYCNVLTIWFLGQGRSSVSDRSRLLVRPPGTVYLKLLAPSPKRRLLNVLLKLTFLISLLNRRSDIVMPHRSDSGH